jgi:hypothetical protein
MAAFPLCDGSILCLICVSAVAREFHGERQQGFVAAGPSYERESDGTAGKRSDGQSDLGQSAKACDASEAHDAHAERFQRI